MCCSKRHRCIEPHCFCLRMSFHYKSLSHEQELNWKHRCVRNHWVINSFVPQCQSDHTHCSNYVFEQSVWIHWMVDNRPFNIMIHDVNLAGIKEWNRRIVARQIDGGEFQQANFTWNYLWRGRKFRLSESRRSNTDADNARKAGLRGNPSDYEYINYIKRFFSDSFLLLDVKIFIIESRDR